MHFMPEALRHNFCVTLKLYIAFKRQTIIKWIGYRCEKKLRIINMNKLKHTLPINADHDEDGRG